ncbi:probable transcriptional regulatory protein At2g25830 [Olea europaea var. sylvestris]|uniref:Probable transcriptional regulatory At2g25830 isoform X2 n=1 Tax=Olea europaea subsp. europaea TaxID=158383 RepID=A0A8S0RYW1_OLEEU|nr:probable transcriptional regulatory protein At2g25830 [Olea europaea var. sylvestris]CAA2984160.1 probable transcriptional regulatory At2g25830 isoform X2 [Olea europaea subsp. europaea]
MVSPSSSTIRAFGSLLSRFSNGVSLKPSNSFTIHGTRCLSRKLQSSSCYSSSSLWVSVYELHSVNSIRKIATFPPLCMGRRSCKIAGRKTAQDAKKTKLYSKIGKEVVSAVKKGGASPVSNTALAALFEKAKELDVPKEIIERNIKRASEKGQEAYIEKVYEVYGYGGVGIIVEVLTDKINRSVAAVREVVKDCGGKMADPGSISFKFKRARVVNVKVKDADRDQILAVALDAGADDVIEPSADEDDPEDEINEMYFRIVTSSESYPTILTKLREEGIPFEPDNGFELLPLTPIEVDDEAMDLNKELMSKLLELDDVDAVYTDQK